MASFRSIAALWGRRLCIAIGGWFALWLVTGLVLSVATATLHYGADIESVLAGLGRALKSENVWARLAGLTALFSTATIFAFVVGDFEKPRQHSS